MSAISPGYATTQDLDDLLAKGQAMLDALDSIEFEGRKVKPEPFSVKSAITSLTSKLFGRGQTDNTQNTALHTAARDNDIRALRSAIRSGLDVNAVNRFGQTPLHMAASEGNVGVILELVEAGANLQAEDMIGDTPLQTASLMEKEEATFALVEAELKAAGSVELHMAAYRGDIKAVKAAIKAGCDLNVVNSFGQTPLHLAATSENIEVISELIKAGANLQAKDVADQTPLESAQFMDHKMAALSLVEDVNQPNSEGLYPLDQAIAIKASSEESAYKKYTVIKLLLDRGADINAEDSIGMGVLDKVLEGAISSAERNQANIVQLLLSRGASPVKEEAHYSAPILHLLRQAQHSIPIADPIVEPPIKPFEYVDVSEDTEDLQASAAPSTLGKVAEAFSFALGSFALLNPHRAPGSMPV